MTTRYVSLTGSNTSPYDTLAKGANLFSTAYAASSDGDTILIDDGVYNTTQYEAVAASGACTVVKSLTVQAINSGAVTFRYSSGVNWILKADGGKTVTFNGIKPDMNFSNSLSCAISMAVTFVGTTTMNYINCEPINLRPNGDAVGLSTNDNTKGFVATFDNLTITSSSTSTGIPVNIGHIAPISQLVFRNPQINFAGGTNASTDMTAIKIRTQVATTTNLGVFIIGGNVSLSTTGNCASNTTGPGAISITDTPNVVVYKPTINVSMPNTALPHGIFIDVVTAGYSGANCRIIEPNITIESSNSGYGALIGHDSSNAFDNLCNNSQIIGATVTGVGNFATQGHGQMLGWQTDSQLIGGITINSCHGAIIKGCITTIMAGMQVKDFTSNGVYDKAGTNNIVEGNTVIQTRYVHTGGCYNAESDGSTNTTGSDVRGNIYYISSAIAGIGAAPSGTAGPRYVRTLASQTSTHKNTTIIYDTGGLPLNAATACELLGANLTIAGFKAAAGVTAALDFTLIAGMATPTISGAGLKSGELIFIPGKGMAVAA